MSSSTHDLEMFLSTRAMCSSIGTYTVGTLFGSWRVMAFIGKGGSGEVYRVENVSDGRAAALKVFVRKQHVTDVRDVMARDRFEKESEFLSKNTFSFFPRFFEAGFLHHVPYFVLEFLDPVMLPHRDRAVAKYLLAVCEAVRALHRNGFVHRDIKPQNIMRRANGELVLIDFGLVKKCCGSYSSSSESVTIVDDCVMGVGTPRYGAPEQFTGGEISPTTDIHALGILVNECFGGSPKGAWARIVKRSTSSIPAYRFHDVNAFIRAVHYRHVPAVVGSLLFVLFAVYGSVLMWRSSYVTPVREHLVYRTTCENIQTNIVTRRLVDEKIEKNQVGFVTNIVRVFQKVTNTVSGVVIRLSGENYRFSCPIHLDPAREYWIVGPGTLDADIRSRKETRVHLENCTFLNRTKIPLAEAGIRYVFVEGAYLNFVHLDDQNWHPYVENFDGAYHAIEFKGPETIWGMMEKRSKEDASALAEFENQ